MDSLEAYDGGRWKIVDNKIGILSCVLQNKQNSNVHMYTVYIQVCISPEDALIVLKIYVELPSLTILCSVVRDVVQ